MERLSVPRSVAMKITGHKTESVDKRYAIVSDSDRKAAAQRLETLSPALHGRCAASPCRYLTRSD